MVRKKVASGVLFAILMLSMLAVCNITTALADNEEFKVVFNITIPRALTQGETLSIGCNMNNWNPADPDWVATKVDDTHYTYTWESSNEEILMMYGTDLKNGETINLEYKYTIQKDGNEKWDMVELNSDKSDISDRKVALKAGTNTLNDKVQYFMSSEQAIESKQTLSKSRKLDITTLKMAMGEETADRKIRVLLPSDYDADNKDKKYPVVYLHDGQNLFDRSSSSYGEWGVDEAMDSLIKEEFSDAIIVGIDSEEATRMQELCPSFDLEDNNTIGFFYERFVVETVKPYIDQKYNTLSDREHTVIGGSSMGGTMAFEMGLRHSDIYGYTMCLSTALWMVSDKTLDAYMNALNIDANKLTKMYIYCGDGKKSELCEADELEQQFVEYVPVMEKLLRKYGYTDDMLKTSIKQGMGHTDFVWGIAFSDAYKWFNIDGADNATENNQEEKNPAPAGEKVDESPKTMDTSMVPGAIMLLMLSLTGATLIIMKRKKVAAY